MAAASSKGTTTLQSEDLGESMWKGASVPCLSEVAGATVQPSSPPPPPPPLSGIHHPPMVLTSRNKFVSQHDKEQHHKVCKEKVSGIILASFVNL